MNDLIRLAMERAIVRFGGHGSVFNAAGFSQSLREIARIGVALDGEYVRVILCGRPDVELLSGGAHFRLLETAPEGGEVEDGNL